MMTSVSRNLGTMDAPPAVRATRPGWRDPRLWIGVALVAASVLVGAKLVGDAQETTEVWAARADLAAGQPVTADDLVRTRVHLDADTGARYIDGQDELPDDARLARDVGEGELVPAGAFDTATEGLIELQIASRALPDGLAAGERVSVWVDSSESGDAAVPVLQGVLVISVPKVDDGFGGGGERQVLLGVAAEQGDGVGKVLAAVRDDRVSLTREG